MIEFLVSDIVEATKVRLVESKGKSVADVRQCRERLVIASPTIAAQKEELEKFLHDRVYRHPNVLAERAVAERAVRELFWRYSKAPQSLPPKFQSRIAEDGVSRSVCDYLANMTDRFALGQYRG